MLIIFALLFAASLLCFIVAAAQSVGPPRLMAAGAAFWVLVLLIQAVQAVK